MRSPGPMPKVRCAVYTRKSSEEGLDQEFNSLDAQREACEAYVASQKHEGWVLVPDRYDDGGVSGGTLERPAIQRLLTDVERGLVDVIVVYKVDRLTRSLMDFARLVDLFDAKGVSFVSITQQFNTTTSMGRLTLNVLLSFAQFEREVASERIRDKFAASRKKGMWMGGHPPLGYDVKDRKLVVNDAETATVRMIFERFLSVGSATVLARTLAAEGVTTKRGKPINKGCLYKLLNNQVYIGKAVYKGTAYPGEHEAIIDQQLWDRVHAIMSTNARRRGIRTRAQTPAPLRGLIHCRSCNRPMSPSHTRRRGRLYRYYVCANSIRNGAEACPVRSVAAGEIEGLVVDEVRQILKSPEIVARTAAACRELDGEGADAADRERAVIEALSSLDPVWNQLFPGEQARILRLLIDRIEVAPDGIEIRMRTEGLHSLVAELSGIGEPGVEQAA